MGNMVRTVAVLTLLCAFSGFILSYLKNVTAPAIEEQLLVNVQGPAIAMVFNNAENNPLHERHVFTRANGESVTVFPCKVGNRLTGVAIENFGKGYGGPVGVIVGFNIMNDSLAGIGMTTLKETPGLGMRVKEFSFRKQFRNMETPVALSAQGGKVDAIAGATISSTGVVLAVNSASEVYRELKPEILKKWDN
ncbi:MAG: FMN-binding protein [Desulfovibrionaceae bacterium]|nr:FMN-binding protein [Desulfovibrionaceae bacterium]